MRESPTCTVSKIQRGRGRVAAGHVSSKRLGDAEVAVDLPRAGHVGAWVEPIAHAEIRVGVINANQDTSIAHVESRAVVPEKQCIRIGRGRAQIEISASLRLDRASWNPPVMPALTDGQSAAAGPDSAAIDNGVGYDAMARNRPEPGDVAAGCESGVGQTRTPSSTVPLLSRALVMLNTRPSRIRSVPSFVVSVASNGVATTRISEPLPRSSTSVPAAIPVMLLPWSVSVGAPPFAIARHVPPVRARPRLLEVTADAEYVTFEPSTASMVPWLSNVPPVSCNPADPLPHKMPLAWFTTVGAAAD